MSKTSTEHLSLEGTNESEGGFHFEQIAELEPAVISLVEKLKEKIEAGEYDTLVSDEIGGRIPTLILRKIIKLVRPNAQLATYFISGGHYLPDAAPYPDSKNEKKRAGDYEKLSKHIQKITENTKSALISTQFIFKGGSVSKLYRLLKEAGVPDVDVASLRYAFLDHLSVPKERLFVGTRESHHALDEEHFNFLGVRKPAKDNFSPHPLHITQVIEEEGRELPQDEWREIFGIEPGDSIQTMKQKQEDLQNSAEWERRVHGPLTQEERDQI